MFALSVEREAQIFWALRSRIARTLVAQTLSASRLRLGLLVFLTTFFWGGLFALFYFGFGFLRTYLGPTGSIYDQIIEATYTVFFASLSVMLVFSSGIILYSGLYRSAETSHLLTLPARPERIVLYKFQDAMFFSSWGFLLLGSPMLVAYGIVAEATWFYYAMLAPFMIAFAYIPCVAGSIICLGIVHCMPRLRIHTAVVAGLAAAVAAGVMSWSLFSGTQSHLLTPQWFQETLGRLHIAEGRVLPSWWLSSGLLEAARAERFSTMDPSWRDSILFLAALVSNAMLGHLILIWTGRRVFRPSYYRLQAQPHRIANRRASIVDRVTAWLVRPLPHHVGLMIQKDVRIFRRDPVMWSQFLIFFGLLAFYFINIRRFGYGADRMAWIHMVSFLNLAVVGLFLSTFTTRFIFPMISLEGNRFWILGLLPIQRDTILWGKFIFATTTSWLPSALLILLSDLMLRISTTILWIHQVTCVVLCVGLSAIAVGLGAKLPDLRQSSPSKIAAGFGGTLNLVLSAVYIVAVVVTTALPTHFYVVSQYTEFSAKWMAPFQPSTTFIPATIGAILVGALTTFWSLRSGLRTFRKMEF